MENHVLYGEFEKEYPTFVRGDGVYVYDDSGKKYLDAASGVGVSNIGHGVPEIIEAISDQISSIAFSYGGYADNEPRQTLAKTIQKWVPDGMGHTRSLFCSGGAEANEGALKLAYQYHCERGTPSKKKVISRWQSYHGNTIGALSMSGRTEWRRVHSPYLLDFPHVQPPYCLRCPFDKSYPDCNIDCAREVERVIRQEGEENIAAFIAEPVIGTSMSAVVPPPEYYRIIREICFEYDLLLIVDEVMSGIGRTGRNFAIEHWGVEPDMITTAKGISGGYSPLAVLVLKEDVWKAIKRGSGKVLHSYTYGGNPASCAAGTAVLNYLEGNNLVNRAGIMGKKLLETLRDSLGDLEHVAEVRGKGSFIGVELVAEGQTLKPFPSEIDVAHRVVREAFSRGLLILGGVKGLINGKAGDHFEVLPPYTITEEHINFISDTLKESIESVIRGLSSKYGSS